MLLPGARTAWMSKRWTPAFGFRFRSRSDVLLGGHLAVYGLLSGSPERLSLGYQPGLVLVTRPQGLA